MGEYMEKEMFSLTDKKINGAFIEGNNTKFQKVATHPFLAELQRQSVVAKRQDGELFYFVKGSPEKVLALCTSESRKEAAAFISELTSKGNRVLALAGRQLAAGTDSTQDRRTFEKNLEFLGIIVLSSQLKELTRETIKLLRQAEIVSIMATGDNLETGIAVAKECEILGENYQVINS